MKKLLMLCIGLVSSSYILAQDISDAIRFSTDEIKGTARFKAMSGAFGALGGDMSSVNINPAGSAIFNNGHASASLGMFNKDNTTNYYDGTNSLSNTNFDLNQLGAVFVFNNNNINSPWKKFSLGIAYDSTSDFDDEWIARGTSDTSLDSHFLYFTNNPEREIFFGDLKLQSGEFIEEAYADIGSSLGYDTQQAFLGYWAGIIDPENMDNETNDNETNYISNVEDGSFNHNYLYSSTGYNGKLAFNFAADYNDRLYFGLNLNSHFINYEKYTRLNETNSNGGPVEYISFENLLNTTGSGFSFQLGTIVKITPELRAGVSYNSPTWYRISEELVQGIDSNNADPEISFISDIINIYPEYKFKTPGKLTGSLAYVFGKSGLISFDYSVKDYSQAKFKPTSDSYFSSLNSDISDILDSAVSYRFGGEYRYKQLSFRGGYRFEESPYKDDTMYGNLTGYSLGLGYNFGEFNIDLAFSQAEREISQQLYYNTDFNNSASIQSDYTDFILTLGFRI